MVLLDEYKIRYSELSKTIDEILQVANAEGIRRRLASLDEKILDAGFWNGTGDTKGVLTEQSMLKKKLTSLELLNDRREDLLTLIEIAEESDDESVTAEIETAMKELSSLTEKERIAALFTGEYDSNNAILTFHAGAGGTEAQDWVEMLYRMYLKYADTKGFTVSVLDYQEGDGAGIKSVSILVEGTNAYGYLKSENGVHRLVRISPFDASGRRHTSFASLEVMPEITDDSDIVIRDEDLKVDTYRSSGAGGQHVNKTESAIRITHLPTGIVVSCQNQRSQLQNRDFAMKVLKSRLLQLKEQAHLDRIEDLKGNQMEIAWGSQIRSYTFMPFTLVKDHRSGFEQGNVSAVMDGELDGFINAYLSMKNR